MLFPVRLITARDLAQYCPNMKMKSWKESGVDDRGKKTDEQVESCRGFPCLALDNLEQYVCTMQGAQQIHFQGYPSMAFFGCFLAWACLMLMAPAVYTTLLQRWFGLGNRERCAMIGILVSTKDMRLPKRGLGHADTDPRSCLERSCWIISKSILQRMCSHY